MKNNLVYAAVELLVIRDFDSFDFADKPMEKYCAYNRSKHIQMATNLTVQAWENADWVSEGQLEDFIHGLNHVFFNGVAAGQSFERFKGEDD